MSSTEEISEKKKALLAQKQRLLNNINICDKRIEEVRMRNSQAYNDDENGSDSDCGLPTLPLPSASHLNALSSQLSTCLQATQELTGLQVIQSEVNVLVEPPALDDGRPPPQDGLWREVMAECRVDLVPFIISFYVHKPPGAFSPLSYCGLRAHAVKCEHARELAAAGTPPATAACPSEAVQMFSAYAAAVRSRRTTLMRLADRYEGRLTMEARPAGGYLLRCGDALAVSWTLQNKWSLAAPFQHRLKFDLDYMDESYVKQIRRAYRQLQDPALTTDERTGLLAEIVDVCRAAGGDTLEQEPETALLERQPREQLPEEPQQELKDSEVMAPPKQLPRRIKPKRKENVAQQAKTVKRPLPAGVGKTKVNNEKDVTAPKQKKLDSGKEKARTVNNDVRDVGNGKMGVNRPLNRELRDKNGNEIISKITKQSVTKMGNKEKVINAKTVGNVENVDTNKEDTNKGKTGKAAMQTEAFISGNVAPERILHKPKEVIIAKTIDKNIPENSKNGELKKTDAQVRKTTKIPLKTGQVKTLVGTGAIPKQPTVVKNTIANKDKPIREYVVNKDKVTSTDAVSGKVIKDVANKNKVINKAKAVRKDVNKDKVISKDVASKDKAINKDDKVISKEIPKKSDATIKDKAVTNNKVINKVVTNKDKVTQNLATSSKVSGNIPRKVIQKPAQKVSKIPQIKITAARSGEESNIKNPSRISPRKPISSVKIPQENVQPKTNAVVAASRSSPRQQQKPTVRPKVWSA